MKTETPMPRTTTPAVESLLRFVNQDLLAESVGKVEPDTPLFEGGWIDSLKILTLIAFLEKRVGRKIPDELIVMDRFRTITVIARSFLES
ncbi:MAG TPA: acyl carrier protein [Candidatus Angelobacter sp.]|nr:acyl carrier protein [Candidatus Angelobacter sp.]